MGLVAIVVLVVVGINSYMLDSTKNQILALTTQDLAGRPILVMGAGVVDNAEPSNILAFRLEAARELAEHNPDSPLIMTGDHLEDNYNEVQVMKDYLVAAGIDSQRIYLDHMGLSTYDSLYRYKKVIGADQVVIVSQAYHLPRALFLAKSMGIEALAYPATDYQIGNLQRQLREIFARVKDFGVVALGYPEPSPSESYAFNLEEYRGDETDYKEELH